MNPLVFVSGLLTVACFAGAALSLVTLKLFRQAEQSRRLANYLMQRIDFSEKRINALEDANAPR